MQLVKILIFFPLNIIQSNKLNELIKTTNTFSSFSISEGDQSTPSINELLKPVFSKTNSLGTFPLINQKSMTDRDYKLHDDYFENLIKLSKNEYDLDRAKEIHESLNRIIPNDLFGLIVGYDGPSPIRYLHGIVMNKLKPSKKEEKGLDLDNDNFLKNLASIVERENDKFPKYDIFWTNLAGILIKYIFYSRQKMINTFNDNEYERITKDIKSINSIIDEKLWPVVWNTFNLKTINIDDFNIDFLDIEFFENSNNLSEVFIKALKYTYRPLFIAYKEKREILKFDCNEFKMEFFKSENPNVNILLKLFMIRYDNKGEVIKECLEIDTQLSHQEIIKKFHSITITKELIEQIKTDVKGLKSRGIEHFTYTPYMRCANSSTMKYILENKNEILIRNEYDLYWLLRRMKETDLLNKKNIKTIVQFKKNHRHEQNTFEKHLKEFGKILFITIEENNLVKEYLNLFRFETI